MTDAAQIQPITITKGVESQLPAVINKLFASKTPAKFIKTRPGAGGMPVKYVEIGYVTNELNRAFGPFWEFKVADKQIGKKQVWVQGQLTIKDPKTGFSITKETFGGSDIKVSRTTNETVDIANDLKAAVSDCTKKCASMFGIAADVFFKEQDQYDQMETVVDVEAGEEQSIYQITTNKYFAVAAERGFEAEDAKSRIKRMFNVPHMADLKVSQLQSAIDYLQKEKEVTNG